MTRMIRLSALCALTILGVTPALAEEPNAKTTTEYYQDWRMNCVENEQGKQCSINQTQRTEDGRVGAMVNANVVDGSTVLEFVMPLMVDLTKPARITVDGETIADLPFNACNNNACFIVQRGNEDLVDAFQKGDVANLELAFYNGGQMRMNMSLKGFSSAMNGLRNQSASN